MATPEPKTQGKTERRVSLTISVTVNDMEQSQATDLENAIRDLAEATGAKVLASHGSPITNPFGG